MHTLEWQAIQHKPRIEFGPTISAECFPKTQADVILIDMMDASFMPSSFAAVVGATRTDKDRIPNKDGRPTFGQAFNLKAV